MAQITSSHHMADSIDFKLGGPYYPPSSKSSSRYLGCILRAPDFWRLPYLHPDHAGVSKNCIGAQFRSRCKNNPCILGSTLRAPDAWKGIISHGEITMTSRHLVDALIQVHKMHLRLVRKKRASSRPCA